MRSFFTFFKRKKQEKEKDSSTFSKFYIEKKQVLSLTSRRIPTATQLRHLPEYLTNNERFLIRFFSLLIVASVLVVGIRFWQNNIIWIPRDGGVYTEALVGFPRYINPVLAIGNNTDSDLTSIFFPGLVTLDENDRVIPQLAENYEVNENSTMYTFTLKENLKWDDGEPLTIEDVMFTFKLIQDSSYVSPWNYTFQNVKFEQVDDRTITATLDDPSILFIRYFTIGILPAHRYIDVPPSNFLLIEDNTRPTGAGPYKFKSLIRSRSGEIRSMTLEKNPYYFDEQAHLEEIRFRFYPDISVALDAVRNREAQGIAFVPPWYNEEQRDISHTVEQPLVLPQVTALFFNLKNDLYDKKNFRRALILGTDRVEITDRVAGSEALISEGPFTPGFIGFAPDLAPRPQIVSEAESLLDEVGYKRGDDGIRKNGDNNLRLVITTLDQDPYPQIADVIKENWEVLGIEVEVQLVEPGRFTQDVLKPRRYDLLLYGELFDQTLDPYAFWHSSQALDPGLNYSYFVNKKVDTLLEESRKEWSLEKRTENYQEVQRIIADELPAIFLYTPVYQYQVPQKLQGQRTGNIVSASERFNNISRWYTKTKPVLSSSLEK